MSAATRSVGCRATLDDAAEMAPLMRREDAAEVWALSHMTPLEALESSLALSGPRAWTVRYAGKIMAMWGIVEVSVLTGVAAPWVLTTAEVDRHPKEFMRISRAAVRFLRRHYSLSINKVDARYDKALRWAARLGFTVQPPLEGGCLITLGGE